MAVSIFKTKPFARFTRKENISDQSLAEAIDRLARGLVDADLGSGLIKQRVARKGHGRSGGYRMLVAYAVQGRAIFLYGFAKNEKDNIGPEELASLHEIAAAWLTADSKRIDAAIAAKELQEVTDGGAEN